jgi:hypothetical protein
MGLLLQRHVLTNKKPPNISLQPTPRYARRG